jgi:hypothetical protein
MCSPEGSHSHQPPGTAAFLANWRQPGPLRWKVQRVLVNTGIKIWRRQQCCGHGGEPGC